MRTVILTETTEPIEGELQDVPDDNGPPLSLAIKNSVITQEPVGIIIKVGDVEHVTNTQTAQAIGLKLIEIAAYLTVTAQIKQQELAQRVMGNPDLGKIVDSNGRPIVL